MAQKKAAAKSRKPKVEDLELEDDDFEVEDEEEETQAKSKAKGRKAKPKKEATPKGIGARQIAERLECEPKTFRAWLRRKVADGQYPEISEREPRSRYDFGMEWTDDLIVKIMEDWKSEPHERGAGLKKAQEAKAKKAGSKKSSSAKKKAPAKKKAAVVEDDDDDDEDFDDED